jgi:hypothetical protein
MICIDCGKTPGDFSVWATGKCPACGGDLIRGDDLFAELQKARDFQRAKEKTVEGLKGELDELERCLKVAMDRLGKTEVVVAKQELGEKLSDEEKRVVMQAVDDLIVARHHP